MLAPNIIPVAIVKAPVPSSQSITLKPEPATKPGAIVSYNSAFTNKKYIKFHTAIDNCTDKLGRLHSEWRQSNRCIHVQKIDYS